MLRHYAIVTNTIIISTYRLNSVRKYRSSCCQNGIKKEKGKTYKKQTLVVQYIDVDHQYFTLITNRFLNLLTF